MNLIHKEFLIALANGEEVEFNYSDYWESIKGANCLAIFEKEAFEFRIKPKPVTLSMEIPMPFVPKVGEEYWFIDASSNSLISCTVNDDCSIDKRIIALGVYRTEDEAEQALAAHEAAIAKLLEGAK